MEAVTVVLSVEEQEDFRRRGAQLSGRPDAHGGIMEVEGPIAGTMRMSLEDLGTISNRDYWLSSREIDFYMSLIMRDNDCLVNHAECRRVAAGGTPPVVTCLTPFFYSQLVGTLGKRVQYATLMNWIPNDMFRKTDLFLIPVNDIVRKHWVLVAVDLREKRVEFYDSAKLPDERNDMARSALDAIARFLEAKAISCGSTTDWRNFTRVTSVPYIAQQEDGIQCGVFMLAYACLLARGHRPPFEMMRVVSVRNMRDRIAYEVFRMFVDK